MQKKDHEVTTNKCLLKPNLHLELVVNKTKAILSNSKNNKLMSIIINNFPMAESRAGSNQTSKNQCRFYYTDNEECQSAERALKDANIPFVKLESGSFNTPLLIAPEQICRSSADIIRFASARVMIKKAYSIDWY